MALNPTVNEVDRLTLVGEMREALRGLMDFESYAWDERGALTLRGRLSAPADRVYGAIRARLERLGYTPFLRRPGAQDELLAMPGVVEQRRARVWLPVILFVLSILTSLAAGARYDGVDVFANPAGIVAGVPFAASLMSILFVHEMGHYVVGRLRRAPVSLPYFIPLPPAISLTGTMGAVIVQREPMEDRRTILEIGIAGPLAGLAVAIPLLLYGLTTSTVGPPPADGYMQEGNSILYGALKLLVFSQWLPGNGLDVQLNSLAWGAWIGLLVTMLNLLPIGQLDGGHIAYALLGRNADYLAYTMIGLCVALGILLPDNFTWLIWGVLALLIGPRHPPPLNDISRLGWRHTALALFGLLVFALLFMPSPLRAVMP